MRREVVKYNPANTSPEHLFRAPTARTHGELTYLVKQLSEQLEGGSRTKERRLLVGTELETFFFSPEIDPVEAGSKYGDSGRNPNYADSHLEKIKKIEKFGYDLARRRPSEFLETEKQGRIFLEFHTAPQSVDQHLETMERFGDLLRTKCEKLGVMPVIHSQHIHMSLRDNPVRHRSALQQLFGRGRSVQDSILPDETVVQRAFSRVNPLVLLPEEWNHRRYDAYTEKVGGVEALKIDTVTHPEFRKLSSEYAHDYVLNLLLSLRAMYAGCLDGRAVTPIDQAVDTYEEGVRFMSSDEELSAFFGQSTLNVLTHVIKQYPSVSTREITIDQVV